MTLVQTVTLSKQLDSNNENDDDEYKIGLLIIDIFSKYMTVVPLRTKQPKDVLDAMEEGFKNIGGLPETAYTDDEGALNSTLIQEY